MLDHELVGAERAVAGDRRRLGAAARERYDGADRLLEARLEGGIICPSAAR
jgi:hypothetical protein